MDGERRAHRNLRFLFRMRPTTCRRAYASGRYPSGGGVFYEYVKQNILELLSFNTLYME